MSRSNLILMVAVLSLALGACTGGQTAEEILESQEGISDVEIDEDSGQVRVEGETEDGGSFSIGGGEVPDDFPVAVPPDGDVVAVGETPDGRNLLVDFAGADYDDIVGFYEDWIDGSGLDQTQDVVVSDPPSRAWTLQDGEDTITISVSETGDRVAVLVIVIEG